MKKNKPGCFRFKFNSDNDHKLFNLSELNITLLGDFFFGFINVSNGVLLGWLFVTLFDGGGGGGGKCIFAFSKNISPNKNSIFTHKVKIFKVVPV